MIRAFNSIIGGALAGAALCAGVARCAAEGDAAASAYVGPAVCTTCHRGLAATNHPPDFHRTLTEAFSKSAHAGTLFDARAEPSKVVAPFTADSPLRRESIAYAFGAGRGEQRYCDASFMLLPYRWDVRGEQWLGQPVVDARSQCLGCHVTCYDVTSMQWRAMGVTCESCHGPGGLHARDGGKTKMLALHSLSAERRAMVCGQCHADGKDRAKVHPFPVDFRPGDDLSKFFAFASKPKPGPKYTELARSKHMRMNVICSDCHDPHGPVSGTDHQLQKPVNELCQKCHGEKTMAKHAPQAPGDATCATCHMPGGSHLFKRAQP
jgi:predicted CXXCH cytochrome family protein